MRTPKTSTVEGETRRVVFLTFPRVTLLDLAGPWEVFSLANKLYREGSPPYRLELVSGDDSGAIQSNAGLSFESHRPAKYCRGTIDTLVVPATELAWGATPPRSWISTLRRLSGRSRRIVSICAGAFLLAEAGQLDGRQATTHWRGAEQLAARFPKIDVLPDSIFVKDGHLYTSAGVTAGIDLALALVEEDLGQAIALSCARDLVVFMRRQGGQSQYSNTLEAQHTEREVINELVVWASDNLAADLSVQTLADHAHMSHRNFSRVFRKEIGQSPAAFVERLRVDAARLSLEGTEKSINAIASDCGFRSADSMRRSFRRILRVAPTDYRDRFRMQ